MRLSHKYKLLTKSMSLLWNTQTSHYSNFHYSDSHQSRSKLLTCAVIELNNGQFFNQHLLNFEFAGTVLSTCLPLKLYKTSKLEYFNTEYL